RGVAAGRDLRRLGARVVRVEPPTGDPLRQTAPSWDAILRAGTESVVWDLKDDVALARALCARAAVVLEGSWPGGAGSDPKTLARERCTARSRASAKTRLIVDARGTISTTSATPVPSRPPPPPSRRPR